MRDSTQGTRNPLCEHLSFQKVFVFTSNWSVCNEFLSFVISHGSPRKSVVADGQRPRYPRSSIISWRFVKARLSRRVDRLNAESASTNLGTHMRVRSIGQPRSVCCVGIGQISAVAGYRS